MYFPIQCNAHAHGLHHKFSTQCSCSYLSLDDVQILPSILHLSLNLCRIRQRFIIPKCITNPPQGIIAEEFKQKQYTGTFEIKNI